MKNFRVTMASDWEYDEIIKAESIDALVEMLNSKWNCPRFVINLNGNNCIEVTIYDDYIE